MMKKVKAIETCKSQDRKHLIWNSSFYNCSLLLAAEFNPIVTTSNKKTHEQIASMKLPTA